MAGGCRTRSGPRWSPCCRHDRRTRWAATTRGCRTAPRWTPSSSSSGRAASGTRCARRRSARLPRRTGVFRSGWQRACSRRSGARGCWPTTRCGASTGPGWHWTGRWARRRWVGGKTGRNPTDRGKRGVKRLVLTDGRGVPLGATIDGANRNDHKLTRPTLEAIPVRRPEPTCRRPQHLCLDKGFDYDEPRARRGRSPRSSASPCTYAPAARRSAPSVTPEPRRGAGWWSARIHGSTASAPS